MPEMKKWDIRLKELKDKYLHTTQGDFEVIDVVKGLCKKGTQAAYVVAKCKVCGFEKKIIVSTFRKHERIHGRGCSSVNWDEHFLQVKDTWIGQTRGDYKCVDVIDAGVNDGHDSKLVIVCQVCGATKQVSTKAFDTMLGVHGPSCVVDKDWNCYLSALKKEWIGKKCGDYEVIDVIRVFDSKRKLFQAFLIAKCTICGRVRRLRFGNFTVNQYNHGKYCTDTKEYIGNTYGDQKIIAVKSMNSCTHVTAECQVCHRTYTTQLGDFLRRASQDHDVVCSWDLGNGRFKRIWLGIKSRCTDPNDHAYPNYGGRGIKCEWNSFLEFYNDMWESYSHLSTLMDENQITTERIDVNGNYCKENCKWIPLKEQAKNKHETICFRVVDPYGKIYVGKCLSDFCRRQHLPHTIFTNLITGKRESYKGWTGRRITPEAYDAYWNAQSIPADMDIVYETLEKCYNLRHKEGDTETHIPLVLFEAYYLGGHLPVEAIEALCTLDNTLNLSINYDYDKKRFTVKKKI